MNRIISKMKTSTSTLVTKTTKSNKTTNKNSSSSAALVKSILMPGYADSGSNDTYRSGDEKSKKKAKEILSDFNENIEQLSPILKDQKVMEDNEKKELIPSPNISNNKKVVRIEKTEKTTSSSSIINENASTATSLMTVNLNSEVEQSPSKKEETRKDVIDESCSSTNSNTSVQGSEVANTVIVSKLESTANIASKKQRSHRKNGITEEMLQGIKDEPSIERWKEDSTPRRTMKKFGMFPMTTPNDEQIKLPMLETEEQSPKTTAKLISPSSLISSPLQKARQCFSNDMVLEESNNRFIQQTRSFSSPTKHSSTRKEFRSQSWEYSPNFQLHPKFENTLPLENSQRFHTAVPQSSTPSSSSNQNSKFEQQDALDILACLVERSLAMDSEKPVLERGVSDMSQIQQDIDELLKISKEASSTSVNGPSTHVSRKATVNALLKSHTYALEMKRAAFSASTWLQSVEHQKSFEKDAKIEQLNQELSKCRAEIGRLKNLNRTEKFKSPNKSILDVDDDSSSQASMSQELAVLEEAFSQKSNSHENNNNVVSQSSSTTQTTSNNTVNVQMLNSENFITDWTELSPPLPPPPDHSLYSPIISTLLQQWTNDPNLHTSLLTWMEQVLYQNPPFPPLKITGVDYTIKEGFCMHLFPLLLRRSDVTIEVMTRAERKTTYDVGVNVSLNAAEEGNSKRMNSMQRMAYQASKEADSVTSSSLTSPISNKEDKPAATIMSAIGNTFTGLLKQKTVSPVTAEKHPYHRVVSVPPGRIGVTFVDFRGHAMVSDVLPDSPLKGWVFPSDVLIAMDEVPVSGMRVKDIVKLLKSRTGRMRALRVISSRDMTELTNNG